MRPIFSHSMKAPATHCLGAELIHNLESSSPNQGPRVGSIVQSPELRHYVKLNEWKTCCFVRRAGTWLAKGQLKIKIFDHMIQQAVVTRYDFLVTISYWRSIASVSKPHFFDYEFL